MASSRKGHPNQHGDCESNTKNIHTKFYKKILNDSLEIEEHTPTRVQKYPKMDKSEDDPNIYFD